MSTRETQFTAHPALGGLDISSDPTVLDPNFLIIADNIEYKEGGQRKKRPGHRVYSTGMVTSPASTATNTIMVTTSASVRALADFWAYGASIVPVQRYIAVTGASIYQSPADGTWSPITVSSSFGSDSNRTTNLMVGGDKVVVSDGVSQPIAVSSAAALVGPTTGANWPIFTAARYHLNRMWYFGLSTSPSAFNFTAANNIFDSTGADSGAFTISVGDGDAVIGCSEPFYASLYIFKGPHHGDIYQLSGKTPSDFSLVPVTPGAPLLNHRALVTTPTDIFWLSRYGVHSLQTTVKFGNVEEAFLSLPIQRLWRDRLININELDQAWGFWHPIRNIVGWCVRPQGETNHHWLICYNYALSDPKPGGKKFWSIWKTTNVDHPCGAVLLVGNVDSNHQLDPHFHLGTMNGQVWEGDQDVNDAGLNDAGQAYTATIQIPVLTRFKGKSETPETSEKEFCGLVTYFNPKGQYSANVSAVIDRRTISTTISLQGGGDPLG